VSIKNEKIYLIILAKKVLSDEFDEVSNPFSIIGPLAELLFQSFELQ